MRIKMANLNSVIQSYLFFHTNNIAGSVHMVSAVVHHTKVPKGWWG